METIKEGTGIMFKKVLLATFAVIAAEGKYLLKAFSNVTEDNLVKGETTGEKYIASFRAIAADQIPQLKQVFEGKEEVPIEDTNGLFLTGNIWKRGDNTRLPMKNELCEVTVELVDNKEKTAKVLRITNVRVAPAKQAEKLDIVHLFADAQPSQVETAKSDLVHA